MVFSAELPTSAARSSGRSTASYCAYSAAVRQALTRRQIAEQIGVGIGVEVTFERCSREEAEAALKPIMGDEAGWYLDLMAGGEPQHANDLVAKLTGTAATTVAQWAARNAKLF